MAHTFLSPAEVASLANELVRADGLIPFVGRSAAQHFAPGVGASVDIRKPAVLKARTRTVGSVEDITTDTLTESYQSVTITEQAYSAVDLTDADLTLNLADFGRQVLAPQALAVAEYANDTIVAKLQGVTADAALSTAYDAANPVKTFTAARRQLRALQLPSAEMLSLVGTNVYADLLDSGAFDQDGSRDANIRSIRGFTVVESNRINPDDVFVYMREAVQLVSVAPAAPRGAGMAQTVSQDGLSLSWLMDYDARKLQDRSVLSVFLGAAIVTVRKALPTGTGPFTPVDVTPVIRVTTA
ncbi:hypothetical protein ABZU25_33915 [Micromonospora sp. NPDC005215]|uniref:phage major capsid protein n=1 Tax=Micromonospora sp. NPDC005215 TaxID=3157024 RepID=UPI0033B93F9C